MEYCILGYKTCLDTKLVLYQDRFCSLTTVHMYGPADIVFWLLPCFINSITVTSWWMRWHLKSPALGLFTQAFIQAQVKANIKAPRHWPLWGNSPANDEFPAQMAGNAETVSIWWRQHGQCPLDVHLVGESVIWLAHFPLNYKEIYSGTCSKMYYVLSKCITSPSTLDNIWMFACVDKLNCIDYIRHSISVRV